MMSALGFNPLLASSRAGLRVKINGQEHGILASPIATRSVAFSNE